MKNKYEDARSCINFTENYVLLKMNFRQLGYLMHQGGKYSTPITYILNGNSTHRITKFSNFL